MTINAKPKAVQGRSRSAISETRVRWNVTPNNRRSRTTANPRNRHRARTWTDSTMGYIQIDSCKAMLPGVFANHSQKLVKGHHIASPREDQR